MFLSKVFKDTPDGERLFVGYEFTSIGARPEQNFHCKQLDLYVAQGVAEIGTKYITMKFTNGTRKFKINSKPGIYCAHCDAVFPLDGPGTPMELRGQIARDHIESEHPGEESPDPQNPSGYSVRRFYNTTLQEV